jgi:nicotinamide mononucleotide transporter
LNTILQNIWGGLTTAQPLDQINLVLGVTGVVLMVRRSLWAFPVGLAAVAVQAKLFWDATFYADAKLQGFFFVSLVYGWWHWMRHKGAAPELPVTKLGWSSRLGYFAAAAALTLAWGAWQQAHTNAVMPYRDAFIASFSMGAQILQVRKNVENWPVWVAVNVVAIVAYWSAELAYTAFLYALYLVLAFAGWREWARTLGSDRSTSAEVKNA